MKVLILIAMLVGVVAVASAAEKTDDKLMLFPQLLVWSNGVDLRINNMTQDDYSCSGMIYINHLSRRVSTEYYYNRVFARQYESRHFFNRLAGDRIVSARHNVYCHRL